MKKILKNLIGADRLSNIKGKIMHLVCKIMLFINRKKTINVNRDLVKIKSIFSTKDYHIFRGYYDISYLNKEMNYFLCHRLKKNDDECEVGYFNLDNGEYNVISKTHAWCWQQGSRLRWHPIDHKKVIFNSVCDDHYCSIIYDINMNKVTEIINRALYDFTPDFKYGLSLNFSRLQRLRPGYGYSYLKDDTNDSNAPKNDGIFLVDIKNNKSQLIYSLDELAERVDKERKFVHYINHISVCPDGKKFMFFHIYKGENIDGWKTILYISDINGNSLISLEEVDRASHYHWIDSNRLIVTCRKSNGTHYYAIYDVSTLKKEIILESKLKKDGHPSLLKYDNCFITDTYPLKNSLQSVLEFNTNEEKVLKLAELYHDYRLRGEKRCDLHPTIEKDGCFISIDTTFKGKRRSVVIFEKLEGEKNE